MFRRTGITNRSSRPGVALSVGVCVVVIGIVVVDVVVVCIAVANVVVSGVVVSGVVIRIVVIGIHIAVVVGVRVVVIRVVVVCIEVSIQNVARNAEARERLADHVLITGSSRNDDTEGQYGQQRSQRTSHKSFTFS